MSDAPAGSPFRYRFPRPALTVDLALVHPLDDDEGSTRFEVLLIRRGHPPFAGAWAFPGGFVDVVDAGIDAGETTKSGGGESLEDAARRELEEETGIRADAHQLRLRQLHTFGAPERDPRGRVVSVVFWARLPRGLRPEPSAADDAADARWFGLDELLDPQRRTIELAFDHLDALSMLRERAQAGSGASSSTRPPSMG